MMEPFERIDIQELPLSVPTFRHQVEDFLGRNGLRLGEVDLYLAVLSGDGSILAGGGLQRDILKCLAVSPAARSLGLSVPLISRLLSIAADRGFTAVKVFTKPENRAMFESLGFKLLASAPQAILLENGRGLEDYCAYLRKHPAAGVIVMNGNPFTLGHAYLAGQAARGGKLAIIPVKEDASRFPYEERVKMMKGYSGSEVEVLDGSDYQISAATFPTYFLKNLSDAAETQMRLDIDLFGRHIAPALGATTRFVGSEPTDPLTARYNALMQEMLPAYGVQVVEIPRLTDAGGPVSASRVRAALDEGSFRKAEVLTPAVTRPYLLAELMARALRMELEAPMKPGLVDPAGTGAHADMDYPLMAGSIDTIRRSYVRHRGVGSIVDLGKAVEADVLAYTKGVNTYRGAIFCLILMAESVLREIPVQTLATEVEPCLESHGGKAVKAYGVKGALQMAKEGYQELFESWLPYYRLVKADAYGLQKTLLKIMSELDDTCVIHRVGYERAQEVKTEAKALLDAFGVGDLQEMNRRFAAEGISPGGAADMLALTIFVDSILH